MKNKGIIITLIILLAFIIIGLIIFLILSLTGKLHLFGRFNGFGTKSTDIIIDEKYKFEGIENIEVLSKAGDVTFKESTDNQIRIVVYGQDSSNCKISVNDGKIKIDYSKYYKYSWFGFFNYTNDIIVYIPNTYSNEINITNNYGECNLADLENATITIKSNCGEIKLGKARNVNLNCDYGNIEIDTILNKCIIESNCGDIKINNLQIQGNSSIESDLGNIKIKEINDIYVDVDVDLGDVNVNKNNRHSNIILKIESDCGNVKVGE